MWAKTFSMRLTSNSSSAALVGDDRIFILIGAQLNPVEPFAEQVDGGGGVESKHLLARRRDEVGVDAVEGEEDVDLLGGEPGRHRVESHEIEGEEAAREGEIVADEVQPAEQPSIVGKERIAAFEADLPQHGDVADHNLGIAETVEHAQVDGLAMSQKLLVHRFGVAFGALQEKAQRLEPARRETQFGLGFGFLVVGFFLEPLGRAQIQRQSQARRTVDAGVGHQRLQLFGADRIFRGDNFERPKRDRFDERELASEVALRFAVGCVDGRALGDRAAFAQRGIAEGRLGLDHHDRRRRRQIVRRQLVKKIDGEIGELVLQFELHARREESRALEQADDQGIAAVFQQRAQPLGDLGEFLREFRALDP